MEGSALLKRILLAFFLAFMATLTANGLLAVFGDNPQASERSEVSQASSSETPAPQATLSPTWPLRVGIQAGHWKNHELPDEFERLRLYGGGATVGNVEEWEVNLDIAKRIAAQLEKKGILVDILPATVPPGYSADIFLTIHADGNDETSVTGYKIAASEFDTSDEAQHLSNAIETSYGEATGLRLDPNITDNMTRYYAFNFHKFNHTVAPTTIAVMVELGFLTNAGDRRLLVSNPDKAATGVADGILAFLRDTNRL